MEEFGKNLVETASTYRYYIAAGLAITGLTLYYARQYFKGGVCRSKAMLNGKTVIITGANSGIGFETAIDMAKRKARVILACRSVEKGEKAAAEARKNSGNEDIVFAQLDLSSLDSVRQFAAKMLQEEPHIDILINNAGVMAIAERQTTKDGFEMQFGVNHLGHFLLTNLLLDRIKEAPSPRIVNLSSSAQRWGTINFNDLNSEKSYSPWPVYLQSKLANVVFTRGLATRLVGTGVIVNAVDPGYVRTELQRHVGWLQIFTRVNTFFTKSPLEGAQTSIHCAVCEEMEGVTGKFVVDCKVKTPNREALDDDIVERLWQVSAQMVGL